jgi:hypothetical protein
MIIIKREQAPETERLILQMHIMKIPYENRTIYPKGSEEIYLEFTIPDAYSRIIFQLTT